MSKPLYNEHVSVVMTFSWSRWCIHCSFQLSKNLQGSVKEIKNHGCNTNNMQIDGYEQLKEFTKSVELMSGKFDLYEKKHEEEQEKENTDTIVLNVFREKLNIDLSVKDLGRSHRIGEQDPENDVEVYSI